MAQKGGFHVINAKRRYIYRILLILLAGGILIIMGCFIFSTWRWKWMEIPEMGRILVPKNWEMYENGGLIYFVDADNQPMMIETKSHEMFADETNDFFTIQELESISGEGFSNSAYRGRSRYMVDGELREVFTCNFSDYDRSTYFIVYSDMVDWEMMKQIAKSYHPIRNE